MQQASIYQILNHIQPLTQKVWQDLEKLFEPKQLKRNAMLTSEGDRVTNCYFLIDGIIRVYYNKDGNEYNKTFFTPGSFPTPITALLSNSPSQLNFQALTECQLLSFSYKKFRLLFEQHRCLESLMLKIMEYEWIKKEKHDIQMVTNDATRNYEIFKEEYPGLEQLIPQYHIASYLGITPIQLSRIRSQRTKGK